MKDSNTFKVQTLSLRGSDCSGFSYSKVSHYLLNNISNSNNSFSYSIVVCTFSIHHICSCGSIPSGIVDHAEPFSRSQSLTAAQWANVASTIPSILTSSGDSSSFMRIPLTWFCSTRSTIFHHCCLQLNSVILSINIPVDVILMIPVSYSTIIVSCLSQCVSSVYYNLQFPKIWSN